MAKIRPNNLKNRMAQRNPKPSRAPEEGLEEQEPVAKRRGPTPKEEYSELAEGKLEAIPEDWDAKKHKPLRKKDFADEATYFDFKAAQAEERAIYFREQAEEIRKLGTGEERAKKKKLQTWLSKIAALKAELEDDGVDVSSLIDEDLFATDDEEEDDE